MNENLKSNMNKNAHTKPTEFKIQNLKNRKFLVNDTKTIISDIN